MSANNCLREALFETLNALLSPDTNIRQSAEQQIKIFEVTDDYGWHLTEIRLSSQVDWPIRQLAALLLKQYIQCHWSANGDKFQQPQVTPENKQRIRRALLTAIGQPQTSDTGPEKKLISSIAFVVSAIGHYDWPEEWPELMPSLLTYISSGNHSAIYASMKIFAEMCHEVIDTQIPAIAPVLLPKMLEILRNPNDFSIRTRGRAVQVFTFLSESIIAMGEYDKVSIARYLDPVLPHFVEILIHILQLPDTAVEQVDIGLRKDSLDCLTILLKNCRKRLVKWMPSILSTVWHSLTCSATVYVNTVVNSNQTGVDGSMEAPIDSDGETIGLESFIFSLFEFVGVLIGTPKSRKLIKQGLADLIYYILIYMQITDEQIQVWSINPDQFVDDEDEDTYAVSIRLTAQDVLLSIAMEFEENESPASYELFKIAFVEALKRHFTESNQIKHSASVASNNNSHSNWWKIQESCLLALGSLCSSCMEVLSSNSAASTDLKCILDTVFMGSLDGSPFFSGRLLWTAARFVEIMPPSIVDRFLQITIQSFANSSPVMKICAVRAVNVFAIYFNTSNQDLVRPYLQPFLDGLLSIGIQYSSEVLALVLETIVYLVKIDDEFTAANESKITPLAIATFLRDSFDPILIEACQSLFKSLSRNESCSPLLQARIGPTLHSILVPTEPNNTSNTLQPATLDILGCIVKSAPLPLSDTLMQLFHDTITCILSTSDDNSTLQNGGECVRSYVNRSTDQVLSFRDSERTGLQMVLQVCLHLLDPRVSESCSAFVGRLISTVIAKLSNAMGPDNIHLLLRSVLSKLQNSETLSVIQSLVLVFANLIHYDMKTILDFLSSIPGPTGSTSALEFVLSHWLGRQQSFFGNRDRKVTILALCKLFEYSLQMTLAGDNSLNLNLITVAGDPVFDSSGIQTRSKTRNVERWTQVPCTVKILKILLAEINLLEENLLANGKICDDDDVDDADEGSGDETTSNCDSDFGLDELDEEDDSDDESQANDPISTVNLNAYLIEFVSSFKKTEVFAQFHEHLNQLEQQTVAKL